MCVAPSPETLRRPKLLSTQIGLKASGIMRADLLLTPNAGSSTIKIGLFEVAPSSACRVAEGMIDFHRHPPNFHFTEGARTFDANLKTEVSHVRGIMAEAFGWLDRHFDMRRVRAVGHRVVHGGDSFAGQV